MKLQVTPTHFSELLSKGYGLDHIYLLKLIDEGYDIKELTEESIKIATLHQSLVRKGLITEENKLTIDGRELIIFIDSKEGKRIKKMAKCTTEFDLWWSAYPKGDTFEYKNRKFEGCRTLRVREDDCRTKFNTIVLKGEVTANELVEALKLNVFKIKEMSVKTGINKLTFMQNSFTYLNQCSYDSFVDEIRKGVKIEETKPSGGTDI